MVFPHTLIGTLIGTLMLFPEPMPGELLDIWFAVAEGPPEPWPPVVHLLPMAEFATPMPVMVFPQTFTGMLIGTLTLLPDSTPGELLFSCVDDADGPPEPWPPPVEQVLPSALLRAPMPVTVLPQTFTGTSIGTAALLPEAMPGELLDIWFAVAEGPPEPWPPVVHLLPMAEFTAPMPVMVFPQTFTGAFTGTATLLPDPMPGESLDA
jgi:hypothetical protein